MKEHIQKKVKTFRSIFADKSEWNIHSGKWSRLEAQHAFTEWTEMHPIVLELYGNKDAAIIKFVILPQFLQLKQLNLKNNKISTLHALSKLQAHLLEELLLGDNFITEIRQLTKMNCPNLVVLSLYANRVTDIQRLSYSSFDKLEIVILGLNCIASFEALNKCHWPVIAKISVENNRRVNGSSNRLGRWKSQPEIVYG